MKQLERENAWFKKLLADLSLDNAILKGSSEPRLLSPARKLMTIERVRRKLPHVSERRARRVLNQTRSTRRHRPKAQDAEPLLVKRFIELACVL